MVAAELPVVHAYAARRVIDPEDVAAEVFATAWRHRAKLPDPPRAWLLRTASNHVLHAARSQWRRTRLAERVGSAETVPVVGDHADAVSSRLDAVHEIDAAMVALRPADREILRLHAWEQLGVAELAYVLGCTQVAAKVRLHRACRRLAAQLGSAAPTASEPSGYRRLSEALR